MIYNMKELAAGQQNNEGQTIKRNSLVRTAYILPTADHKRLIEELGIETIFDFRGSHEINKEPNFTDLDVIYYPLGKKKTEAAMKSNTITFQAPDMVKFYAEGLDGCQYLYESVRDIVTNPRPLLYHCTAGKDRTGMFSIVLMHILGFSKEQIKEHYLVIDPKFIEDSKAKFSQMFPDLDVASVEDLLTVKPEYFDAYYQGVIDKYTNFDNYIAQYFELSDEEIRRFKDYYLN